MTKKYYISENVQKHHKDELWLVPEDEFVPINKLQQLLDEVNILKKSIEKLLPKKVPPNLSDFTVPKNTEWWKVFNTQDPDQQSCLWDSFSAEEKSKPMMLSCPCSKCSPWSL